MVETLYYSKIFLEDLAIGTSTKQVQLSNGVTRTMNEISIKDLVDANVNNIIYSDPNGASDDEFRYVKADQQMFVHKVAGDDTGSQTLTLEGSSHATLFGDVLINPRGGRVCVGASNADTLFHVKDEGSTFITVENSSATPNDAGYLWKLAGVTKWHMAVDDSDGDKLKIGSGGTVGTGVLTFSGTAVGVNVDTPLASLHARTGATLSLTPSTDADDCMVESAASGGITIANGNANTGILRYSSPAAVVDGWISYSHGDAKLRVGVDGTERWLTTNQSQILVNGYNATGLGPGFGVDQGANTGLAFGAQADTIAHGVTSVLETSTFWALGRESNTEGGVDDISATEGTVSRRMSVIYTTEDITDTLASTAPFVVDVKKASGTGVTSTTANGNLFGVAVNGSMAMLLKGDGDIHTSSGAAPVALDDHDDIQLVQTLRALQIPSFKAALGEFFEKNLDVLETAGVITRGPKGSVMYSHKGIAGLTLDAIRQLGQRVAALEASL